MSLIGSPYFRALRTIGPLAFQASEPTAELCDGSQIFVLKATRLLTRAVTKGQDVPSLAGSRIVEDSIREKPGLAMNSGSRFRLSP